MKKFLILFTLFSLSCSKTNINSVFSLGSQVTADYSKNISFKEDIALKVTNIEDSRCPTGVQCPWAGMVRISINFSDKTNSKEISIDFFNKSSKTNFELSGQKFEIEIFEVTPYPSTSKTDLSNYKVNFVLKKI